MPSPTAHRQQSETNHQTSTQYTIHKKRATQQNIEWTRGIMSHQTSTKSNWLVAESSFDIQRRSHEN